MSSVHVRLNSLLSLARLTILIDEEVDEDGPIEENTPHDQIRKEPYPLPKEFEWCTIDLNGESEVCTLLRILCFLIFYMNIHSSPITLYLLF